MRNVNKLFPRLPIRVKLVVVFALLVTVPLLVMGAYGTRETLDYIEAKARTSLHHDLETASERTERFLLGAEEDLAYVVETILTPILDQVERGEPVPEKPAELATFLRQKPRFFQIRLIDPQGESLMAVRSDASPEAGAGGSGAYYVYRAGALAPGTRAVLAVEVRDGTDARGEVRAVPAIAIVEPIRDGAGRIRGVVVGEVYASRLFEAIEAGSPDLRGTTGLVDSDGQYLYHSSRKRDWNTLLATRPEADLSTDYGASAAARILRGGPGTLRVAGGDLVSFRSLHLSGPDGRPLHVYRAVPASVFVAPARRFLGTVGAGGALVLAAAMVLAFVAATQFTRPIHRLREATQRLAAGEFEEPPVIETNDEIEDLAKDFGEMAVRLRAHRQHLEDLVAERTAALREAHAELAEILAHTDDAILRLDPGGKVRVWNRGAERMFGYGVAEATGRRLEDMVGRIGPAEPGENGTPVEDTVLDRRVVLRRADGSAVEASLSQTSIRGLDGEAIGHTVVVRDETRQRELERRMIRSERLAAAGRLAAGVVHEINNPIGIIVNRLDLLDGDIDERCGECFARSDLVVVRQQAERVGWVARRLLTLAREDTESRRPMDLNELAAGVATFLRPELRKRGLALEVELAPDLPEIVVNPHEIETVLLNLLLNAMDASPEGGVIGLTARAADEGPAVQVEVEDEGSGVPAALRERIFEPFFTTKVKPPGTGLGLAVCQGVVQAHGGEIRVESARGVGSRFTVVLPIGEGRSG